MLPDLCLELLNGLRWGKTMRWNSSGIGYPRPLRWIVALYGDQVMPFTWAGVASGRSSRGPRFADAAARLPVGGFTTFPVAEAEAYFDAVAAQGIIVDRSERASMWRRRWRSGGDGGRESARRAGAAGRDDGPGRGALGDAGQLRGQYLELPEPVLIGVMKKHQRYYPVVKNGKLVNLSPSPTPSWPIPKLCVKATKA